MKAHRLLLIFCVFVTIGVTLGLLMISRPAAAQIIPFATNTPRAGSPLSPTATLNVPDAPFERYALRLLTEADVLGMLESTLAGFREPSEETALAVALIQGELARRFPAAPRSAEQRDRILMAMLSSPRGQVDARSFAYGYIADALTAENPIFNATYTFERAGFRYTLTAANFNGAGALDAIVHVTYPASAVQPEDVRFDIYVAAEVTSSGAWRVLPALPAYPAAPLGSVQQIMLERAADLTGDSIAELAVAIDDGSLNRRLEIFGWRGDRMVNLLAPGETIAFGLINALDGGSPIVVQTLREESARWNCLSQQEQRWSWSLNAFRRNPIGGFRDQNTLGCAIYRLEPIFSQPWGQSRSAIETLLMTFPVLDPAVPRARVALAMLTALSGNVSDAANQMITLREAYPDDEWVQAQASAFLRAASNPSATPLQLCGALHSAGVNGDGMCDPDDALEYILTSNPPLRSLPLSTQLAAYGLITLDQFTITEAGRLPRELLRLRLSDFGSPDLWWIFAPLQPDTYTATRAEPPAGSTPEVIAPSVLPPTNAYTLLIDENNPRAALTLIDTAVRAATEANPFVPISPSLRYMRALAYDLLNDRVTARQEYFNLWTSSPGSVWGQLAAAHLERR
ncbi:hypothetical protein QPK87_20580 [Kamptonema cortianum]|nr:hypothetical protein [Kamptonema cortianum]